MYLQELLEVAIGLIFVWLVLSIATMQIQEWIASNVFKWRAKDLEATIRKMLGETAWAEQLYEHPVIAGLSKKINAKPSYISANKFAVALFDVVMTAGTDGSIIQQSLYTVRQELNQAPKALVPLIRHALKRGGSNIWEAVIRIWNFLVDAQIVTKNAKYEELLLLVQNAATSEGAMRAFLEKLISDEYKKNKEIRFKARDFIASYRGLDNLLYEIYKKINEKYKFKGADEIYNNLKKEDVENILAALKKALEDKDGENYALKLLDILKFDSVSQNTLERLNDGLNLLSENNPGLHRSLNSLTAGILKVGESTTLMDAARKIVGTTESTAQQQETRLANARTEVENWFNEAMTRLSGWYKRKSQLLALVIGLILATILNVDSIALAKHLWREPAVRQALAATANQFIVDNPEIKKEDGGIPPEQAIQQFQKRFEGLDLPLGWEMTKLEDNLDPLNCRIPASEEQIVGFIVPFTDANLDEYGMQKLCLKITNAPPSISDVLLKILGVLISGVAVMQGAPFWFDILKKLVNVRSAGANPAEKTEESTSDKER